jgi:hypothetical protein
MWRRSSHHLSAQLDRWTFGTKAAPKEAAYWVDSTAPTARSSKSMLMMVGLLVGERGGGGEGRGEGDDRFSTSS